LLEGKHHEKSQGNGVGAISVHDVAEAHIAAAEKKEAAGNRYLVSSPGSFTREDLNKILIQSGEFKKFPLDKNEFLSPKRTFLFDNTKVQKELGIVLSSIPETVVAMAKALIDLKIVKVPEGV